MVVGAMVAAACSSGRGGSTEASSPAPAVTTVTSSVAGSFTVVTTAVPTSTSVVTTAPTTTAPSTTDPPIADQAPRAGATRLHFEVGPLDIQPGQNNISFSAGMPKPDRDGWIVRIAPNLRLADNTIPGVDVIHLHHGVWLNVTAKDRTMPTLPERFFAAGEEKTALVMPDGYGYRYRTTDTWVLNYMIHNLWPKQTQVWVTYDLDLVPADGAVAGALTPVRPLWTDVQNGSAYPVFDARRDSGAEGTFTYPDDAAGAYGGGTAKNQWVADRDYVLVGTAGHLHPGGLHSDLWLDRSGATAHLFTSTAHYWEPAGAVSWDVAMTATPPDWRVAVRAGDTLRTTATYDTTRASWYESMGIMVVWAAEAPASGDAAPDPFVTPADRPGVLTHGHLPENDNHGARPDASYVDAALLPSRPATASIGIDGFVYAQGDLQHADAVPTVVPGAAITFDNIDAPRGNGVWHTITSCKAPCTGSTGIAFPLADGEATFDSGELGNAGPPTAGRVTWTTPTDLAVGTYTYFCRIHPFMRGAFRVATPA